MSEIDFINILLFISVFVLGFIVGSFLNVLVYRLPKDLSIFGRSFCPHCKKPIRWHDNIPLLSFVLLRGKCRHCGFSISLQYPIVEAVTGVLFVLVFLLLGIKNQELRIMDLVTLGYYLFIISALIAIFFADLRYGIIPDKVVYPTIAISLLFLISQYPNILISNLLSALAAFLFFFFLFLITRGRGMGMGDVKLVFLMGLFLGFPKIAVALYIAFLTGAAISLILVLWGKKKFSGGTVPFGPFLVFGTLLAFFFGEKLLRLGLRWLSF